MEAEGETCIAFSGYACGQHPLSINQKKDLCLNRSIESILLIKMISMLFFQGVFVRMVSIL